MEGERAANMKTSDASRGTWLGVGHPHANASGYAVDDPGEPAQYRCDSCGCAFCGDDLHVCACEETGYKDLCEDCARCMGLAPGTDT